MSNNGDLQAGASEIVSNAYSVSAMQAGTILEDPVKQLCREETKCVLVYFNLVQWLYLICKQIKLTLSGPKHHIIAHARSWVRS